MDVIGDFEPMCPGFVSRGWHDFFFFFFWIFFYVFILFFFFFCLFFVFFFVFFLSLLLQCKLANSTLLSLLSFSYFITPYDAQASSAFSALIFFIVTGALCYIGDNGNPRSDVIGWSRG